MSAVSQFDRYHGHYPGFAQFAILCEGDFVGYEKDLLEKWFSDHNHLYVDVWPCGTAESLLGFCDAIGRSVRVAVIQDRDYYDTATASKVCEGKQQQRAKRGVEMAFWRTWQRNEIENYLIEPPLLCEALIGIFPISEAELLERLTDVIHSQAIDQAAQSTLFQARAAFPTGYSIFSGLPKKTARPRWNDVGQQYEIPSVGIVKDALVQILDAAAASTKKLYEAPKVSTEQMIASFEQKLQDWANPTLQDACWRVDWSGKEILQGLYEVLASIYGFRKRPTNGGDQSEEYVKLTAVAGLDRSAALREIEWSIQPALVSAFLNELQTAEFGNVFSEWCEIAAQFKS